MRAGKGSGGRNARAERLIVGAGEFEEFGGTSVDLLLDGGGEADGVGV